MIAEEKWLEYLRLLDLVCIYCHFFLFFNVKKKIKVTFLWIYLGIL